MVKVIAFDVFGTVVDWHGSIARHVDELHLGVDGSEFATAWRAGYAPAMDKVRSGQLGWTRIDDLNPYYSVKLKRDPSTGLPCNYGFVEMKTPDEARIAAAALNATRLDGRLVSVSRAVRS